MHFVVVGFGVFCPFLFWVMCGDGDALSLKGLVACVSSVGCWLEDSGFCQMDLLNFYGQDGSICATNAELVSYIQELEVVVARYVIG